MKITVLFKQNKTKQNQANEQTLRQHYQSLKNIYEHSRHAAHSLQLLPNARHKRVHVEQLCLSDVLMWGILLCGGAGDQRRPRHLSLCARGEVASPRASAFSPVRRERRNGGGQGPRPTQPGEGLGFAAPGFPAKQSPQGVALWLPKVWRKVCFRSVPSAVLGNTTFLPRGRPVPLGFWEA